VTPRSNWLLVDGERLIVYGPGEAGRSSPLLLERQGVVDFALITTQRAYESVSKVVQASDEMLSTANGLRR